MIDALIHTAVRILIGWLLIDRVPAWLNIRGIVATILKVIGVLIISVPYYTGFKNTHNWLFNNKRQLRLFYRQQIYMATYPIIQKNKRL